MHRGRDVAYVAMIEQYNYHASHDVCLQVLKALASAHIAGEVDVASADPPADVEVHACTLSGVHASWHARAQARNRALPPSRMS